MAWEAGKFLSVAELDARLDELRQQIESGVYQLGLARGAAQEMEFVKRRIAEPDPVEAPPPKAGETECPPSSDSPLG